MIETQKRPNIKDIILVNPDRVPVPLFDPQKDISREIKSEIEFLMQYGPSDHLYPRSLLYVMMLGMKVPLDVGRYHFMKHACSEMLHEGQYGQFASWAAAFKLYFPDNSDEVGIGHSYDSVRDEINGNIGPAMLSSTIPERILSTLVLDPERKSEIQLDDDFFTYLCTDAKSSNKRRKIWSASFAKIFYPEKDTSNLVDTNDLDNLKARVEDEGNIILDKQALVSKGQLIQEYIEHAAYLAILAADSAKITDCGIELHTEKPRQHFSSTGHMPQRRRF